MIKKIIIKSTLRVSLDDGIEINVYIFNFDFKLELIDSNSIPNI